MKCAGFISVMLLAALAINAQKPSQKAPTGNVEPVEVSAEERDSHRIGPAPTVKLHHVPEELLGGPIPVQVHVGLDGAVISAEIPEGLELNDPEKTAEIPKQMLPAIKKIIEAAKGAALQTRYKPFQKDGQPITATLEEEVLVLLEEPLRAHVNFPQVKQWNSLVMTLERSGCFGTCAAYRIEVHGDGTVLYEGRNFVAVMGKHRATIAKSSVEAIVDAFRNADYFSLREKYEAGITDNPTYRTSIAFDGHSKQVIDYVGGMVGMPESVTQLEKAIDQLSESERWTRGNADTFRALADEGWDFHSAEAAATLARIAQHGSAAAVQDFVKAGAGVDARENWGKNSALDLAARRGDMEMVEALLQAHPPQDILTSALSAAAAAGHLDAVQLLIQSGADPIARSDWPPLVAAASAGVPSVVKEILKYGPDPSLHREDGGTALIVAVNRECCNLEPKDADRPAVVTMLLEAGANINQRDSEGNTALIQNAWDPKIAEILLRHGADINAQRNDGWTALFSASSPELAQFLLEHGADTNIRDKKGETALEAARHYSPKVAAVLEQAQNRKK